MKIRAFIPIALLVLTALGCQRQEPAQPVSQGAAKTAPAEPPSAAPPPEKIAEKAPESPSKAPESAVPAASHKLSKSEILSKEVPNGLMKTADALDKMKVPEASQKDWRASDLTAEQIAKSADEALGSLAGVYGEATMQLKVGGGSGRTVSMMKIQDPSHFSLEYIDLDKGRPTSVDARADGVRRGYTNRATGGKWIELPKVGQKGIIPSGSKLVSEWPSHFPRYVLSPMLDGRSSFTAFVQAMKAGDGGYTMTVERRDMSYGGRFFTSYRLVAERGKAATSTLGPSRIEMVFDGNFHLPVTIRTSDHSDEILWTTRWAFNKTFDAKEFLLPKTFG